MTKLASCDEHVLSQESDEQLQVLRDENSLLFDQLELLQRDLVALLGDCDEASSSPSFGARGASDEKGDVLDRLLEAVAENIRCQSVVAAQEHLFFLRSRQAMENQLGKVLIDATTSIGALVSAPFLLWRAWRQSRNSSVPKVLGGKSFKKAVEAYELGGLAAVEALMSRVPLSFSTQANAWTAVARSQLEVDVKTVASLARRAYELEPLPFRQKWLAFRLYEAGEVLEAEALMTLLPKDMVLSESEDQQLLSLLNGAKQYRFEQARDVCESAWQ